ncbi:MAG: benzoyl-CoA reductase subunit C [Bacteroidetes bacterium]|nr:benzoyl-CoA reductase subunit C [Bacteroidota bacterium]
MNSPEQQLEKLLDECKTLAFDLNFTYAKDWKKQSKNRLLVGYLPIYVPREIIHAANALPVGIMGVGDRKQIIKGDAYYQSYICHLPRGIIEMALDHNLENFDGFLFPAICDCVRNLSGMFKIVKKGKFTRYFDYPQNFDALIGGVFYRELLETVIHDMYLLNGVKITIENLNHSIKLYNINRRLIEKIYDIRQEFPWRLSAVDVYHIIRAGLVITVEKHNEILEEVVSLIEKDSGEPLDNIRVVVSGSFCEQPPVGLIKSIEMAGCYIVDDDFMLGSRWIQGDINAATNNPVNEIVKSFLEQSAPSSAIYDVANPKGKRLVDLVKKRKADGVIFCAASFCDPALLDRPDLQKSCDEAGVNHINFQFHENTGQFKVIKEQAGTFSDSIKLWV